MLRPAISLAVHTLAACWSALAAEADLPPAAQQTVDFAKDIQPVFQKHCYACHGPDKQKNDLRLDRKSAAIKGGESGPAIVPEKSAESLLVKLVAGIDPDRIMPQKGERLTATQVGLLRAWIDQGAAWPDNISAEEDPLDWWSLKPFRKPAVPGPSQAASPIDAFVVAKLAEKGLRLSPEADRRTLIRRLYFNLIGLPPSPEEIAAFERDTAPNAYEQLVDHLLSSPRYGERWARHWMDVAHFAETHGHDQDRVREHAWPYRDYLIDSFNADKPYPRFVEEQVAGDALYPSHPSAIVALGFLASGPWDESSLRDIREDTLDRQIGRYLDRDDVVTTVMQTFASSTVQCARCHDHKFDPISQRDYYALQAVFAGVDRANRRYDADPAVHERRRELKSRLARVKEGDRTLLLSKDVQGEVEKWAQSRAPEEAWRVLEPETFVSTGGANLVRQKDGSFVATGTRPERDTYTISWTGNLKRITAIRLELLPDDSLPKKGPGRMDNGNLHLNEIQLLLFERGASTGNVLRLSRPSADFNQEGWTINHAIDGDEKTAWGIYPNVGEAHEAVLELAQPLVVAPDAKLTLLLKQLHGGGHLIGRFRVSVTEGEGAAVAAVPQKIRSILARQASDRTEEDRLDLAAFQQREAIERQLAALPAAKLVYAAASDFEPDGAHKPTGKPRLVHVLHRGDIRRAREEAQPGALECVAGLPARFSLPQDKDESARRAALARWLTHPENSLTWRSIVNRVWHYHFGRGIVETPNDFGRMGGKPSHPELLDWLATWFRDSGGSLKELHRLIVTSAVYRQSSGNDRALPSRTDSENGLLWRMNRTRLDAESVRDAVLAISGRLDFRMGGPSDRHFDLQPGLHVTPKIDYAKFDIDSSVGHRRSVYRFLFRTLPDPMMDALDCPAGDQLTPSRNASVTVQQALAMWNSAFMARHCEHLAERVRAETDQSAGRDAGGPSGLDKQISRAFELALGRKPTTSELADFAPYGKEHGLANVWRVLLNSNEFLFID